MEKFIYWAPSFALEVCVDDTHVKELSYLPLDLPATHAVSPLGKELERQLDAYFKAPKFVFDLPYELKGTPHQQAVWRCIATIPSGDVLSYGEVAKLMSSGPRAVGGACGRNTLPLLIPCHRVIAHNGLGGFSRTGDAEMLKIKRWLLRHEGAPCSFL